MRGIDEWLTGEDESMVAGVGEGARSRAWLPSGASQEACEEAWERWPGRGVEERERHGPAARERRAQGAGEVRAKPGGGQAGRHRTGARRTSRGERGEEGQLGFAGGELGRMPVQQRAAQQGGEARVATCGHVGSDVAVHVGSQRWSEVFWTSSDTLE